MIFEIPTHPLGEKLTSASGTAAQALLHDPTSCLANRSGRSNFAKNHIVSCTKCGKRSPTCRTFRVLRFSFVTRIRQDTSRSINSTSSAQTVTKAALDPFMSVKYAQVFTAIRFGPLKSVRQSDRQTQAEAVSASRGDACIDQTRPRTEEPR